MDTRTRLGPRWGKGSSVSGLVWSFNPLLPSWGASGEREVRTGADIVWPALHLGKGRPGPLESLLTSLQQLQVVAHYSGL